MQTVLQQIACHGIAEAVEEVRADTDKRQVNPRLVLKQVGKGLERELLSANGFQSFLGEQSASQRSDGGKSAEDHADDCILMLLGCHAIGAVSQFVTTNELNDVRERQQRDEPHGIGSYHAIRRELVFLVVVFRHHAEQRTVGHVHGSVDGHHQQVERVGPDAFAHRTEVGRVEQQGEDDAKGHGTEDEPRAIGAPARLCTIGQRSHQWVGNHIEHSCHKHQGGCVGHGQTENVGEEQRKGDRHDFPCDAAGSSVAERIAYFFS